MVHVVIFEDDLDVALEDETLFFLVSQFKDDPLLKLTVMKFGACMRVQLGLFRFFTLVNIKYRYGSSSRDVGHFNELDALQAFKLWR